MSRRMHRFLMLWFFVALQAMTPFIHAHAGAVHWDHADFLHLHRGVPHVDAAWHATASDEHGAAIEVVQAMPQRPATPGPAADLPLAGDAASPGPAAAAQLELRLRQEARADFEAAVAQAATWQQAERAAQALEEAARLAARAYSLGEGSLDQVLLTRRLALEGRVQARQAQVAALAANARLKLDSHRLWPLDADADAAHAHP